MESHPEPSAPPIELWEEEQAHYRWLENAKHSLSPEAHSELSELCLAFHFKMSIPLAEFGQKMVNICFSATHLLWEYNTFLRGARFQIGPNEKVYLAVDLPELQVLEMIPPTVDSTNIENPERLVGHKAQQIPEKPDNGNGEIPDATDDFQIVDHSDIPDKE